MTIITRTPPATMVGVFLERSQAEGAIDALRLGGFRDDQIGSVAPGAADSTPISSGVPAEVDTGPGVAGGAVTGAITGGLVATAAAMLLIPGIGPVLAGGVMASALTGGVIGTATGGLMGALIHLDVAEDDADYYNQEFRSGSTIVTVRVDGQGKEAAAILNAHGARNIDVLGTATARSAAQTELMGDREARLSEHDGDPSIRAHNADKQFEHDGRPEGPEEAKLMQDAENRMLSEGSPSVNPSVRDAADR